MENYTDKVNAQRMEYICSVGSAEPNIQLLISGSDCLGKENLLLQVIKSNTICSCTYFTQKQAQRLVYALLGYLLPSDEAERLCKVLEDTCFNSVKSRT